jgi:hypothetical protein
MYDFFDLASFIQCYICKNHLCIIHTWFFVCVCLWGGGSSGIPLSKHTGTEKKKKKIFLCFELTVVYTSIHLSEQEEPAHFFCFSADDSCQTCEGAACSGPHLAR